MPVPRPVYVTPYSNAIFRVHLPEDEIPMGKRLADRDGAAEAFVYSSEDIPALKLAAEKIVETINNPSDKSEIQKLLGILSVHEQFEALRSPAE